jgi:hypothetical protein
MKKCNHCDQTKPIEDFPSRINHGKPYIEAKCRKCKQDTQRGSKKNYSVPSRSPEYRKKYRVENRIKNRSSCLMANAKRYDKSKGFETTLTREYVEKILQSECLYCGATEPNDQITLDRLDNTKGHTNQNCVAACFRCNMTRANMPLEAWQIISNAMREAREQGLFKGWRNRYSRKS